MHLYKLNRRKDDKPKNNKIKVLFVGTAENRWPIIDDIPELPDLIDHNGNIVDPLYEKSDLERSRSNILHDIKNIYTGDIIIDYMTVDPSYSQQKKYGKDDDHYLGHLTCLLEDVQISEKFDLVSIIGCYKDLFNDDNINKIKSLLKIDGYLSIHDNIEYKFNNNFKKTFSKIKSCIY